MNDAYHWIDSTWQVLRYLPWLILILFTLPLALLAYYQRVFPTTRTWGLLAIPCFVSILVAIRPEAIGIVIAVDALILALLAFDWFSLPRALDFRVERQMQRAASLGAKHPIQITCDYSGNRTLRVRFRDDTPQGFQLLPMQQEFKLPAKKRALFDFALVPDRRGAYTLETFYIQGFSRLGLWLKQLAIPCRDTLHVYPDLKQVAEYAILARTNRLSLIGVRRSRKIGQDNDFERLRDYTLDDNYKFIDWRSTARRGKLTVKDFQSDQSQRVVFMLDCGRMMTNTASGLSLVDHALNSVLMLSYVALQQGDSVGLLSFSNRIHSFTPPRSGKSQMNQILHSVFDRYPELVESRFDEAFLHLSTHVRKRSLVVLITNVIDQVNADQIVNYMSSLQKQHLPLLVLLRDQRIFDAADNPDMDPQVLYRSAAASQILCWREQVLQKLRLRGTLVIDAYPEQMTSPLINQYLQVKAKHLL